MELSLNLGFLGFSSSDRDAITRSSDVIGGGTTAGGVKGDDRVDNYSYLRRLEDEIRKIEPFRRELPLCMILLKSTIERFRTRTQHEDEGKEATKPAMPSIEELFPLKRKSDEGESGEISRTFKKWMSCDGDRGLFKSDINGGDACDKPASLDCVSNSVGDNCRGFLPLQKKSESCVKRDSGCSLSLMSLASVLANPAAANAKSSGSSRLVFGSSFVADQMKLQKKTHQKQRQQMMQHQQNQGMLKKQRRSWSPELHRRFLEVLQKLGGAQAATPKQIREMMKVQGLTNDEVKSHLQKYRLNIQRLPLHSDNPNPISGKWNGREEEEGEEEECRENSDGHSWVTGLGEKQLLAS